MTAPGYELPIIDEDGRPAWLAPLITLGSMYFPDHGARVGNSATAMLADSIKNCILNDRSTFDEIKAAGAFDSQTFHRFLFRYAEAEGIKADIQLRVPQGRTAADVLITVLQLSEHMPRIASVN